MNSNQFNVFLTRARSASADFSASERLLIAYPRAAVGNHFLAVAIVCRVTDRRKEDRAHTVVVCMYRSQGVECIEFWCGDQFLDGHTSPDESAARSARACATAPGDHSVGLMSKMLESRGRFGPSAECNFWQKWRRHRKCCGHVACALDAIRKDGDVVPRLRAHLETMLSANR